MTINGIRLRLAIKSAVHLGGSFYLWRVSGGWSTAAAIVLAVFGSFYCAMLILVEVQLRARR